jgi:glycosyltransferase involved in cell wall biosynthesis
MNIDYYDLVAPAEIHTQFNAAFVNILYNYCKNINSNIDITINFHAEKTHTDIVYELLKNENILIKKYPCTLLNEKVWGGWRTLARDLLGIVYIIRAFLDRNCKSMLVFGLVYPFSLWCIFILAKLKKHHAYVCLHGELEVFTKHEEKGYSRNEKYFSTMKGTILKKNSYLHFLLLGEPIFKQVKHLFKNIKPLTINLPYIFSFSHEVNLNFEKLIVGQIGSGSMRKGTPYLFELAKNMKKEIAEEKIKFVLIGKLDESLKYLDEGLVEYQNNIIDKNEFELLIEKLHFALLLRDKDTGKAIASASFLDALKYNKAFLTLHNDYTDYYLDKIGVLEDSFDTIGLIASFLRQFLLLNDDKKRQYYISAVEKNKKLKQFFSVDYNTALLLDQKQIFEPSSECVGAY